MGTQITIFAFIAAMVMFLVKTLASKADEKGNIYIKTPKEVVGDIRKYITHIQAVRRRVKDEHGGRRDQGAI